MFSLPSTKSSAAFFICAAVTASASAVSGIVVFTNCWRRLSLIVGGNSFRFYAFRDVRRDCDKSLIDLRLMRFG